MKLIVDFPLTVMQVEELAVAAIVGGTEHPTLICGDCKLGRSEFRDVSRAEQVLKVVSY